MQRRASPSSGNPRHSRERAHTPIDPSAPPRHVSFESAAHHAVVKVPRAALNENAGSVARRLVGTYYDCASHIVVCDGERFIGVVRIEDLLSAPSATSIEQLADRDAPRVGPGVDQEIAAWHAVRHGESALCLVDGEQNFLGIIPPQRLLAVLLSEHEEDLSRLGGFLRSTRDARTSSMEPVERRFRHRLPWLLVGLAGALFSADLVGWFQSHLEGKLMLAFFVPGIVYLADAVGTQTETIVVRGLSIGVRLPQMARRELLAGLAIGLALAIVGGIAIVLRWGDADIALIVGLSLFAACSIATLVAMLLPWLFQHAQLDPAFASGPLATVIQDLLSIAIYFLIAAAVLT